MLFAASYQSTQGTDSENDPNNTTVGTLFYFINKKLKVKPCDTDISICAVDICWWAGPKCYRGCSASGF